MPSSLAAALAASKQSGPATTAAATPVKKKDEAPRPSSLAQYQKKRVEEPKPVKAAATKQPNHEKHGKQPKLQSAQHRNERGGRKNEKPSQQKKTPDKSSRHPDKKDDSKSPGRGGGKKKGNAPTPTKSNDTSEEIVFVCDIPSDSDDSDYVDEVDGGEGGDLDGVDEDFEDDDFVDGDDPNEIDLDDAEEGECESDVDDLDFDVVVIMDGVESNDAKTPPRGKATIGGRGARDGGKGGKGGRDNKPGHGDHSGGRHRDKGPPKQQHAGRGKDRHAGRDFRNDETARQRDRSDAKANTNAPKPTSTGLKPTPWANRAKGVQTGHDTHGKIGSTRAKGMLSNQHHHGKNDHRRIEHSRNDHRAHGGRHANDRFPTRESRQHPPARTSNPSSGFAPASTLPKTRGESKARDAAPPVKLESTTIKGRWADEDSSDDD